MFVYLADIIVASDSFEDHMLRRSYTFATTSGVRRRDLVAGVWSWNIWI